MVAAFPPSICSGEARCFGLLAGAVPTAEPQFPVPPDSFTGRCRTSYPPPPHPCFPAQARGPQPVPEGGGFEASGIPSQEC